MTYLFRTKCCCVLYILSLHSARFVHSLDRKERSASLRSNRVTAHDERRKLQGKEPITLVESGTRFVTVKIAQAFLGTNAKCKDSEDKRVDKMFATFLDPRSMKLKCGLIERDVSACFERTVKAACDPITNSATVTVYARDSSYPKSSKTDNPKIGLCRRGELDRISRAIKVTKSFECKTDVSSANQNCTASNDNCDPIQSFCQYIDGCGNTEPVGTCIDYTGDCSSKDDCSSDSWCDETVSKCKPKLNVDECCSGNDNQCRDGMYCNFTEDRGSRCKAYVPLGSSCGGYTLLGYQNVCNPSVAYCFYGKECEIADLPGKCMAFMGECKNSSECEEDEYCDEWSNKCKARLAEGVCCDVSSDLCLPGLECKLSTTEMWFNSATKCGPIEN